MVLAYSDMVTIFLIQLNEYVLMVSQFCKDFHSFQPQAERESNLCFDLYNHYHLLCLVTSAAKNQFHRYYIYGEMQDCSVYWKAFSSCATYTYNKSSESKEFMLEVMKMDEIKFTSFSVWEKRENPGKYWNDQE